MKKFVAVAGNIGVGKSTLVEHAVRAPGLGAVLRTGDRKSLPGRFLRGHGCLGVPFADLLPHPPPARALSTWRSTPPRSSRTAVCTRMPRSSPRTCTCRGTSSTRDYQTYRDLYETTMQLPAAPGPGDLSAGLCPHPDEAHLQPRPRLRADHHPGLSGGLEQPLRDTGSTTSRSARCWPCLPTTWTTWPTPVTCA